MKLTIWRQFSSNHSNSFTIVGTFESVELAKEAERILNEIIEMIHLHSIGYHGTGEPVWAEVEYGKQYEIEWEQHLWWMNPDQFQHVIRIDNYVTMSSVIEATWGAKYFDQIVAKLNGASQVHVENEMGVDVISVELTAKCTSVDNIAEIKKKLTKYLVEVRAEISEFGSSPWHSFAISNNRNYERPIDDAYYGHVEVTKEKIRFWNMKFGQIGVGLPALLAYLKDNGFADIEYTISVRDQREVFEED